MRSARVDGLAAEPGRDLDAAEPTELLQPALAPVPAAAQFRPRQEADRKVELDPTKIIVVAEVVAGAVAVAWRLARRPGGPKAIVRMGPGGWVSVKGGGVRLNGRRYRPAHGDVRPLWARVLRARRAT